MEALLELLFFVLEIGSEWPRKRPRRKDPLAPQA
jgi:hypothetical protein